MVGRLMAYRPFHVPFLPGVHQDVDPAVIPAGGLARVLNGRMPREGGITKRRGSTQVTEIHTETQDIGGPIDAVGTYRDRHVVMGGGRIWERAPGEFLTFRESGRTPRFLPRRSHFLHFNDTNTSADLPNSAAGVFDGVLYVASTWRSGTDVMLVVMNDKGARVFAHHELARYGPRVIRTTTGFLWTYCREDTLGVYARMLDVPALVSGGSGYTVTLSAEPGIALGAKQSYTEAYDICRSGPAGTSDEFLFMRRNTATSITIQRRSVVDPYTTTDSASVTVTNSLLIAAQIMELDNDEVFYTWIDNGNDAYVGAAANDLTSTAETAIDAGDTITQVTLARRSTNSAWCVYRNSTDDAVRATHVQANSALSTTYDFGCPGMSILSRPHKADSTGFHIWLKNHLYPTTQAFQSKAVLARWNLDTLTSLNVELIPDERPGFPSTSARQIPLAAPANAGVDGTTEGGGLDGRHAKWWFPALVTIKTAPAKAGTAPVPSDPAVTVAIYLYEYEEATPPTDSALGGHGDPLAFDTAAGAGFAFGGCGQEITSQRLLKTTTGEPVGFENGFLVAPELTATITNGSGLTTSGIYQALACFEYVDCDGRVHRSCPSNLVSATPNGPSNQITFAWDPFPLTEREQCDKGSTHTLHVYATAANSSIFYRVTPDTSAPSATLTNSFILTTEPNTSAAIIYTLGNVKPNQPAPAHRYGVTALNRLWLFGLFDPRIIECSKFFVPNEPATFTRDPAFRTFAPVDVFCGTEMDGVIYAFGADGIVTIAPGIGPNNQGSPALPPCSLLSRTGCVGTGGLLRVPGGIMFEGRRGMYFLARGGNEPEFVGAPIAEDWPGVPVNELGGCVRSAALLRHSSNRDLTNSIACFAYQSLTDSELKIACYDPESRRWVGVDIGRAAHRIGSWPDSTGDRLVTFPHEPADAPPTATIDADAAADFVSYDVNSAVTTYAPISTSVETGWLRPFGLLGHGEIHEVTVLVTVLDPEARVSLEIRRDGAATWEPPKLQPLTPYSSGGDAGNFVDGPAKRLPGSVATLRFPVGAGRDTTSIRLRLTDSALGPEDGIGALLSARVIYHGVTLWTTPSDGPPLQGTGKRVA
jgi:hypothetical protein